MDNFLSKAPDTNRGAVNTYTNTELTQNIIVDWCQFSIFFGDNEDIKNYDFVKMRSYVYLLFYKLFGLEKEHLIYSDSGINGYTSSISYKNIYAYFRVDMPIMGINFKLSGTGCRDYEDLNLSWIELFRRINSYTHNYNRIDIAIDDFTGNYFTIEKLQKYIKKGRVVSKFKSSLDIIKRKISDGSILGNTLQFGSKASRVQITIYNKLLERQSQNYIVDNSITFWHRTELRFRNERATEIANELVNNQNFNLLIKGILGNYLSFLTPGNDSNKSRWEIAPFWQEFLENMDKIQLSNLNIESTLSKKKKWLVESTSHTNLMVILSELDSIDTSVITSEFIKNMLVNGYKRINDKDMQLINSHRIKNNQSIITKDQLCDLINDVKEVLILKDELPFD